MGRIELRVQPGARATRFVGWYGELPKLAVSAAPVDGEANEAVIAVLAGAIGVRPRQVRLVGGATSRTKRFEVDERSDRELLASIERVNPR
jgi:uncharacterized protein YggU (UPF0235/DUF167 family)